MGNSRYKFLGINFDVEAAIELAKDRKVNHAHPKVLEGFVSKPQKDRPSGEISGLNAVDEDYAAKTKNSDPIIFATCCYADNTTFQLLIDGSHRLFKALYVDESDYIEYVLLGVEDSLKLASGPLTEFMRRHLEHKAT